MLDKRKIEELASIIRIDLSEKEILHFVNYFGKLENLIKDFSCLNLGNIQDSSRIELGNLTLKELTEMKDKFVSEKYNIFDDFIEFKKN